jgi:hypothetical protein
MTSTPAPPTSAPDTGAPPPPVEKPPSRLDVLLKRRRNLLLALLLLLIAVIVAVGSLAVFTSSSVNPDNVAATGSLSITNTEEGQAIFSATGMVPGDTTEGTVTIQNSGDVSGRFRLTDSGLTDTQLPGGGTGVLSTVLQLTITDLGPDGAPGGGDDVTPAVYSGALNAMPDLDLGSWSANERHTYRFLVEFPASAGNEFEGRQTKVTYNWDATSE